MAGSVSPSFTQSGVSANLGPSSFLPSSSSESCWPLCRVSEGGPPRKREQNLFKEGVPLHKSPLALGGWTITPAG